jgi:hypothetical protein
MVFGFCFFTDGNFNLYLIHTGQPQLLLTGINRHALLQVFAPYFNLTSRFVVGRCNCPFLYLRNILVVHVEHILYP